MVLDAGAAVQELQSNASGSEHSANTFPAMRSTSESIMVVAALERIASTWVVDKNMHEAEGSVSNVKRSEHGNSAPPLSPLFVGELKLM